MCLCIALKRHPLHTSPPPPHTVGARSQEVRSVLNRQTRFHFDVFACMSLTPTSPLLRNHACSVVNLHSALQLDRGDHDNTIWYHDVQCLVFPQKISAVSARARIECDVLGAIDADKHTNCAGVGAGVVGPALHTTPPAKTNSPTLHTSRRLMSWPSHAHSPTHSHTSSSCLLEVSGLFVLFELWKPCYNFSPRLLRSVALGPANLRG